MYSREFELSEFELSRFATVMIQIWLVEFQKHTYHLPTSLSYCFPLQTFQRFLSLKHSKTQSHATWNNIFASTIWVQLKENKFMLPAWFEQATIWFVVINNSKLMPPASRLFGGGVWTHFPNSSSQYGLLIRVWFALRKIWFMSSDHWRLSVMVWCSG